MTDIKILIATHKEFPLPSSDIFYPIQVGKKITDNKLEIQGDDDGENISEKNPYYCELTALYWAWKNLKTDVIGLCHYRRYFNFQKRNILTKHLYPITKFDHENLPTIESIEEILKKHDIILPKIRVYPYSLEIDYKIGHIGEDLSIIKQIIKELYPEYLNSFNLYIRNNNKLFLYNMFICKYEIFYNYCNWIFNILFEAEKRIKLSPYKYQQRVFGFLSERLLGVYCIHNNLKIKQLPILFIDENNSINDLSYLRNLYHILKNNLSFRIQNPRSIFKKI